MHRNLKILLVIILIASLGFNAALAIHISRNTTNPADTTEEVETTSKSSEELELEMKSLQGQIEDGMRNYVGEGSDEDLAEYRALMLADFAEANTAFETFVAKECTSRANEADAGSMFEVYLDSCEKELTEQRIIFLQSEYDHLI